MSEEADPEGWLELVYGDDAIITQLDDGTTDLTTGAGRFTSSLSASSTVVSLLELLDVEPGHRVLDVGTGTGWTAALLSRLVGSANVTSVEVDPAVSAQASANLKSTGHAPRLVVGTALTVGRREHPTTECTSRARSPACLMRGWSRPAPAG